MYLIINFADIFSVGQWNSFSNLLDGAPILNDLAEKLPEYLISSKADNTQKKYRYGFNLWCKWSKLHSLPSLPASHLHIALYLIHLSETANSINKLDEAIYAISWAHMLAGFPDPCKTSLVHSVREGAHRKIGHTVIRKEPVTPEILQNIVSRYGSSSCNLKDLRIATMCLISYAGFLRFSELANLKRSNITFCSTHVTLTLEKSKTDVYREGREVVISRTGLETCPVDMLDRYLQLANISETSQEFIFRSLSYCKSKDCYKLRNTGPISYTRARELLLSALESIGFDKNQFGLHSLRSGGATAAAAAGVEDRLFKKHGRWKSEKAKDGYIKENLAQRLSVTKQLGI